ncbi:MAG: LytTR family transcriptional regulator [Treponema sp.]|nr:LytTR family transcriptional regulator [Treponema sp.]
MLRYKIVASEEKRFEIQDAMHNLDTVESDFPDLTIVERGYPVPESGFSLLFSPDEMHDLIRLLYDLSGLKWVPPVLIGKKHETYEPLKLEDIIYFRSSGNSLYACTEQKAYEMKQKLFEMEKLLAYKNFIRVNKSNIVNIMKIKEIIPWFGGKILLRLYDTEERIEVTRNYVKDFKQFLDM